MTVVIFIVFIKALFLNVDRRLKKTAFLKTW